ncbi:IS1096 element passenger TnpR family protein [Methanobrevibacter filiformis]|uniref:Plasmid pRiA4b ORF-3-like protein n=1 Tax=Methanobrevibacter filiformis TaxID=55758 RepID=A0A166ESY7_9EURY|nr:hypothetical protein [Methanobrevibacter filiformis]KZX16978.1 plasmid pRiA4b ORF-3-like protein [Methanobrevibacter filiformis]
MGNESKTYQLKIQFKNDNEEVIRRIRIFGEDTFDDLSKSILESIEFEQDQLYAFSLDDDFFGPYSYHIHPDLDQDSTSITLNETGIRKGQRIRYLYDFKVEWEFDIIVEEIKSTDKYEKIAIIESVGKLKQNYKSKS